MTPQEFGRKCVSYFGDWKEPEHKSALWDWIKTKNSTYLDIMYKLIVESRPPGYGAPSVFDLKQHHEECVTRAQLFYADGKRSLDLKQIEDQTEKPMPISSYQQEWDRCMDALRKRAEEDKKEAEEHPVVEIKRSEPLFKELDGIRGDEDIALNSDYYKNMTVAERMGSYCSRRKT